jgi:hypothetical protein
MMESSWLERQTLGMDEAVRLVAEVKEGSDGACLLRPRVWEGSERESERQLRWILSSLQPLVYIKEVRKEALLQKG